MLLGPRPAIPYEVELLPALASAEIRCKARDHRSLAQVTSRCSSEFDDMIEIDLDYIRKQSFWLDLKIILKTPWVLLTCRGAY